MGSSFELAVCVNGRSVKEYVHNQHTFIEGKKGSEYTVKLKNQSSTRVLAVLSIDGLDVLKGKSAELADNGYIINPYSSIEIKGYRITDNDVASFIFQNKKDSYAATTGKENNVGVIGVRYYGERVESEPYQNFIGKQMNTFGSTSYLHYVHPKQIHTNFNYGYSGSATDINNNYNSLFGIYNSAALALSCNYNTNNSLDLGTSWGEKIQDKVTHIEFKRGELLSEISLYYASKDILKQKGIDFNEYKKISIENELPRAFNDYCIPPKGWNG